MMQESVKWMGAGFGAALVLTAVTLMLHGSDNKSTRLALELTARFSFVLFWLAYAGGALATLFRLDALVGRGREFGLAFAAAHLVHIGLVIWLGVLMGRVPLSGGLLLFFMVGLVFTYLLAFLSFGGAKALGQLWRPLRFVGMNYILIAFARDFILPVLYPKPAQYNVAHFVAYAPFAAACVAAPLLVLAVTMRQRAA
ncbi:MAG: hypothetical protein H0U98_08535 [Alphaproteobacteria bacterium]|nr:hypothetical protein [Alphaproteobacteria bacterium]